MRDMLLGLSSVAMAICSTPQPTLTYSDRATMHTHNLACRRYEHSNSRSFRIDLRFSTSNSLLYHLLPRPGVNEREQLI